MKQNKIIVIDLEATCWRGNIPQGQTSEIIEIGICVLDTATGEISQNQGILVQTERSKVSPFCTELTTITQEMLDEKGMLLRDALIKLREEYNPKEYTWASYGFYDLKMIKSQCRIKGLEYPMSHDHINVKELFTEVRGVSKRVGMKKALSILNFNLDGTHHRGVDDAKNIAKILDWCLSVSDT